MAGKRLRAWLWLLAWSYLVLLGRAWWSVAVVDIPPIPLPPPPLQGSQASPFDDPALYEVSYETSYKAQNDQRVGGPVVNMGIVGTTSRIPQLGGRR